MNNKKILVACEESQAVTKAFRDLGFEAYSCDLLPCSGGSPEWHIQGDAIEEAYSGKYYMMIAHPPCFIGETLITTDQGLKPISEVSVGDKVLTHKGRFQKVTETMSHDVTKLRLIKTSNNIETYTTDEHPYYVRERLPRKKDRDTLPTFTEAKDLTGKHFTGFVYLPEISICEHSDELLWLMGRYVADGYARSSREREGMYESVSICVGKTKLDEFKKRTQTFKYSIYEERTVYKVVFYGADFLEYFKDFGRGAANKSIPNWVLQLPVDRLSSFIGGYLSGDGHFRENKVSASTISKKLAIQLSHALSKVYNRPTSILKSRRLKQTIEGREVNCQPLYQVSLTINPKTKQNYVDGEYVWGKVLKNEVIERSDTVYNISVEEDESYVANNSIVHNCTFLSGSGVQWLSHPEDKHLPFDDRRPHPKYPNRRQDMLDSVEFVKKLYNAPIEYVAIENPVGLLSSKWRKPDQIIQPYMFGDEATKTTCLWLKNLPQLTPTDIVGKGERTVFASGKSHPKWYADALKNAKTKEERQTLRSKTFPGIASAIANQWSKLLK